MIPDFSEKYASELHLLGFIGILVLICAFRAGQDNHGHNEERKGVGLTPREQEELLRREYLGGHDIAAILGVSPYAQPIDVWRAKLGFAIPTPDNHLFQRGRYFEPAIVKWWSEVYEPQVEIREVGTKFHPEHDFLRGSVDRMIRWPGSDFDEVLEVKTVGFWPGVQKWGEPGDGQIPDEYFVQANYYAGLWSSPRFTILAYIGDDREYLHVSTYEFERDLYEQSVNAAVTFWHDYVLTKEPPPNDGSDAYSDFIRSRFPKDTGEVIHAPAEALPLIQELAELAPILKATEKRVGEVKTHLQGVMQDASFMESPWGKFSFTSRAGNVSYKEAFYTLAQQTMELAKKAGEDIDLAGFENKFRAAPSRTFLSPRFKDKK